MVAALRRLESSEGRAGFFLRLSGDIGALFDMVLVVVVGAWLIRRRDGTSCLLICRHCLIY